jgi:DNA-directed RNA polymerase specialized sigma24 family protein
MDSTNLIRRCQAGEAEAITDLIIQHEKRVFRLALSILDDAESAGEVTQDVFLAAGFYRPFVDGLLPGRVAERSL